MLVALLKVAVFFVISVGTGLFLWSPVSAQSPPFTAYGTGLSEGDDVGIWSGNGLCTAATAAADGTWLVQVPQTVGDCRFAEGDTMWFTLNGSVADQTETWSAGGAPADVTEGTVLTDAGSGFGNEPIAGINLTTYSGGSVAQLERDAATVGAASIFITRSSAWVGLAVGGPGFVNQAFVDAFPTGVPAGTVMLVWVPEAEE